MNLTLSFRCRFASCLSKNLLRMCSQTDEITWRGVPLSEIQGSQSPWGSPEFPLVTPSRNHTVLYHVPNNGSLVGDKPSKPQVGRDKWDNDHVRMPCSTRSLYPVEDSNGKTHLQKRWEIIENSLSKPMKNSEDLAQTILSYNTKFKDIWKFAALHHLFNEELQEEEAKYFFDVTLPEIAKLALSLPKLIQSPIPLLKQQNNHSVTLSQQQIACLLANAFFCTFPRRNTRKEKSEYASYPHINFTSLYERGSQVIMEKLKCICHYFKRVCTKVPVGVVTFSRRCVNPRSRPTWQASDTPIALLPLHVDSDNTIEDAHGLIQLDFANKYLGGGVLTYGCVQEEIRFVICPELMISMLFTEMMKPNEALIIIGCERYSQYVGYGNSFQWSGDYQDYTPHDSSSRRRCAVLAVDALPCYNRTIEYTKHTLDRELNKAWIGFSFYMDPKCDVMQYPGVATGNWGCGAFGGCPRLKSLIQVMACVQSRRPMAYYTFNDVELRDDIVNVVNLLARHNFTVGQLYKYIVKFSQTDVKKSNLHKYLHEKLSNEDTNKTVVDNNEKMETSITSETPVQDVSNSEQWDFTKVLENSPDLFSDDDIDTSLIEVKVESQITAQEKIPEEKQVKKTSLVEAMEILDNENELTISSPQTSRRSLSLSSSCDKISNTDKIKNDPNVELKKKISRKITDYFGKKTV